VSGLPIPPGSPVARPSGSLGNLKVLNWAGFKSAISLTFDDSLSSQIAHYSELQATGVRMTFYLVSNNNGSSATWSQANRDGHELGNHTAHHCHDNGTGCAWGAYAGSLSTEDDQCTTRITQTFGASGVWTAASPYGDAGYATTAQSKFLLNRGVQGGQVAPNDATNPFSLPCHLAAQGETATGFNSATDSAHSAGKWQIFLIHSLGGDNGYNPVSITDVVGAVNHAKSLGDVWIDSVVNVGAYWRAQKMLSGVTGITSGSTTTWTWTLPSHFPPGKFLRVTVSGGTLAQPGGTLAWDTHGYYEVALDAGSLTLSP
jgi:peptidoglycan/xylan/chitin deacetylase (PgdA/CDA1 family)